MLAKRVVYVGPERAFHGLEGSLVEAEDRATRQLRLHFQPESDGIRALPCEAHHVQTVEREG